MVESIISTLTNFIISVIEETGYVGIFLLMAAESALIPIPSEVTMPFAGYLASTGTFRLTIVILVGALANLVGSLLAYWLGLWGQETVVRKLIRRYGKWLFMGEEDLDRSERWFRRYGEKIIFFSRLLPVVRTFISLPGGIAKMNLFRFSLFTFVGSLLWSWLLAWIGFSLGKNWHVIEEYYRKFEYFIIASVIGFIVFYLFHKIRKTKHPRKRL